MKNAPVLRFLFILMFFALSLGIVAKVPAAPAPDTFLPHPPLPDFRISLTDEEEDDGAASLPQLDPDIARRIRTDLLNDILDRYPIRPLIPDGDDDEDPPLPEESDPPVPSEEPVEIPTLPETPETEVPVVTGVGSPATGVETDTGPVPTGSIPAVKIPAAGGCSLQKDIPPPHRGEG